MIQKWMPIIILVLIVAWAIPTPTSPVRAQDDEFLTYTDPFFSMQYPAAWQISTIGDFTAQIVVAAPTPVSFVLENGDYDIASPSLEQAMLNGPVAGVLTGATRRFGGDEFDPREVAESFLADMEVISTEHSGTLVLGEADAYEIIGTVAAGEYTFGAHLLVANDGEHFLIYVAGGLQAVFEEYRDTFAHIAQSLQLLDGTPIDAPASDLTADGQTFTTYSRDGYTIAYPATYQPVMLEAADGALVVFSEIPTTLTNEDFALVAEYADDGDVSADLNPLLAQTITSGPMAGVLMVYMGIDEEEVSPARSVLQNIISNTGELSVNLGRQIRVGEMDAAEMMGVVSIDDELDGPELGVYALVIVQDGWVIVFGASAPIDQWDADQQAIFMNMAYSLVLTDLPTVDETE